MIQTDMEAPNSLGNAQTTKHRGIIDNAENIGYQVVAPVIFAIGLAGNIATLITLGNRTKFSGRLYTYLRALAISDLCCLIVLVAWTITGRFKVLLSEYNKETITSNLVV